MLSTARSVRARCLGCKPSRAWSAADRHAARRSRPRRRHRAVHAPLLPTLRGGHAWWLSVGSDRVAARSAAQEAWTGTQHRTRATRYFCPLCKGAQPASAPPRRVPTSPRNPRDAPPAYHPHHLRANTGTIERVLHSIQPDGRAAVLRLSPLAADHRGAYHRVPPPPFLAVARPSYGRWREPRFAHRARFGRLGVLGAGRGQRAASVPAAPREPPQVVDVAAFRRSVRRGCAAAPFVSQEYPFDRGIYESARQRGSAAAVPEYAGLRIPVR
jgi:hypothetical protein